MATKVQQTMGQRDGKIDKDRHKGSEEGRGKGKKKTSFIWGAPAPTPSG